jgi:hypothetical protein
VQESEARLDLYVQGQNAGPIAKLNVPFRDTTESEDTDKPYRYWAAFCVDAGSTLNKIFVIDSLTNT